MTKAKIKYIVRITFVKHFKKTVRKTEVKRYKTKKEEYVTKVRKNDILIYSRIKYFDKADDAEDWFRKEIDRWFYKTKYDTISGSIQPYIGRIVNKFKASIKKGKIGLAQRVFSHNRREKHPLMGAYNDVRNAFDGIDDAFQEHGTLVTWIEGKRRIRRYGQEKKKKETKKKYEYKKHKPKRKVSKKVTHKTKKKVSKKVTRKIKKTRKVKRISHAGKRGKAKSKRRRIR